MRKQDYIRVYKNVKVDLLEDASSLGLFSDERRVARSSGSDLNIQYGRIQMKSVLAQKCSFQKYDDGGEIHQPKMKGAKVNYMYINFWISKEGDKGF